MSRAAGNSTGPATNRCGEKELVSADRIDVGLIALGCDLLPRGRGSLPFTCTSRGRGRRTCVVPVAGALLSLAFLLGTPTLAAGQEETGRATIRGQVVDAETDQPLENVFVRIEGTQLGTFTDDLGLYVLRGVPPGPRVLRASRIGYATARISLNLRPGEELTRRIELAVSALEMEDIRVTADVMGRAEGELGTADVIDEDAIRNQTAVSLQGVLELVPGQPLSVPGLEGVQQVSLRSVPTAGLGLGVSGLARERSAADLSSFGTSIILDGIPLSNNANLQTLGPRSELFIPTSAGGGLDLRRIPAATLERVEVIRGVPSVRWGDLTQGAVIVHTKAGEVEPELTFQADPRTASGAGLGGTRLGGVGTGTFTADLTRTRLSPGVRDAFGSRIAGQAVHRLETGAARTGGRARFLLDSRVDFFQVIEDLPENPDVIPGFARRTRDRGFRFSERARLRLGGESELSLTGALAFEQQRAFVQQLMRPVALPITDRLTEGRQEGEFLIGEFLSRVDVDGDPWQLWTRLEADTRLRFLGLEHRLRPGAVVRREWNDGPGFQFDVDRPPQITFNGVRGFDRPRPFDEIPPLAASALYLDDRVTTFFGGGDVRLDVQAGVRLDLLHEGANWFSEVRDVLLQPRVNVELSPVPRLRLRAGAGRTAKIPALGDLYPGPQWYDMVNVNFFADDPAERLAVITTFKRDPTNPELGFSEGVKAEAGVEVGFGGGSGISVVVFRDEIDGGVGTDFEPEFLLRERFELIEERGDGVPPVVVEPAVGADTVPILIQRPANILDLVNRGVEVTASLPELRPIRTRLEVQGAFTKSDFRKEGLDFGPRDLWSDFQLDVDQPRSPFWDAREAEGERGILTYRAIFHEPSLGFVVTGILQHFVHERQEVVAATDTLAFAGFVTRTGEIVRVPPDRRADPEFRDLRRTRTGFLTEPQVVPADWLFSLRVAKTLPLDGRLTFFAFNAFDREGKRARLGSTRRFFPSTRFGLEARFQVGRWFR